MSEAVKRPSIFNFLWLVILTWRVWRLEKLL
jgi:hypothetical protein